MTTHPLTELPPGYTISQQAGTATATLHGPNGTCASFAGAPEVGRTKKGHIIYGPADPDRAYKDAWRDAWRLADMRLRRAIPAVRRVGEDAEQSNEEESDVLALSSE